jgi:hypothetical protein
MAEKRLAYYRWEDADPVQKDRWTAWTVSVYAPTYDRPYITVLLSMANGGGRCLTRYKSLDAVRARINIPSDGIERLELAITRAGIILVSLLKDLKIIDHAHSLPEGYQLVRTDTGEAIAEAERIIREGNSNG